MPTHIFQVINYDDDTITPYDSLERVPEGDRAVFRRMLNSGCTRSRFCGKCHVILAV